MLVLGLIQPYSQSSQASLDVTSHVKLVGRICLGCLAKNVRPHTVAFSSNPPLLTSIEPGDKARTDKPVTHKF